MSSEWTSQMVGWYVNYYSIKQGKERRSGSCQSFDGALVHARALAINGHVVRSICSPHGAIFEAQFFEPRQQAVDSAKNAEIGKAAPPRYLWR
jgi:hypothetical protein